MTTGYFRSVGGGRPTRTGTHQIGISFGAHRGMVREVAGRGERVDAPVGAVYVTVAHPITWSEVAEPVEALEVYPDPDLVRQCGGDPERVEASLGRPDPVVFGLASRLRAAHLGSAPLDELGGAELAQRVSAHLIAVHDRHRAPQRSPGRLDARVLRRVVEAIRSDPVLVHHIVVSEIVVAVDAVHGLDQLRSEPLGRRQVEVADRLVVTKIDEAADAALGKLSATLRELNPGADISGAVRGSAQPLPDFAAATAEALPALGGLAAAGPRIFATKLIIDESVDWTAFSVWLSALLHARGDDVMRVKGVVRTPAGRLLLQSVRRIVPSPEILPESDDADGREDNAVVVIGRGYEAQDLSRSLRYFASGSPAP